MYFLPDASKNILVFYQSKNNLFCFCDIAKTLCTENCPDFVTYVVISLTQKQFSDYASINQTINNVSCIMVVFVIIVTHFDTRKFTLSS